MNFKLYEFRLRLIAAIFFVIGIVAHIIPYFANHDLWIDEAMLASSIVNRDFGNLIAKPLDYGQSAPVGYLYMVKAITAIAGVSDFSLRVLSLISFGLVLYLMYRILRKVYLVKHYLFFLALFSLMSFYVRYAVECKPYMLECVFVLLVVLLFHSYKRKEISLFSFCIFCSLALWFSFVPVFFIAGALLVIIVDMIRCRQPIMSLWPCILVATSFVGYYIVWLSVTDDNAGAREYWNLLAFPMLPVSMADCELLLKMAKEMLSPLSKMALLFFPLSMYTLRHWLKEEKREAAFYLISLGILLVASSLGFYPIIARLMAFFGVLMLILSAVSMDRIWSKYELLWQDTPQKLWGVLFVMVFLMAIPAVSLGKNFYTGNLLYLKGSEIQPNIYYLNKHIQQNDMIYISDLAQPIFFYKMKYPYGAGNWDSDIIGTVKGRYIIGEVLYYSLYQEPYICQYTVNMENVNHDVDNIKKFSSVYLVTSHIDAEKTAYWQLFLQQLRQYGDVEIVNMANDTYLYHFRKR